MVSQTIEIEKAGLADIEQLQTIGRQTFVETFGDKNTADNMRKYVAEEFTIDKLTHELTNPNSAFYFATLNDTVIGYLKINAGNAQTEMKHEKGLEIERIYVLKAFHGKRAGQILYDTAFTIAKQTNADYLWLGVWEENTKAIAFYRKNGFVEFDKHIFKLGDDEQTDIMMKLQLHQQH